MRLKNPTCGDDIAIQLRLCEARLCDLRQDGTGCSICCTSASMMTQLLDGRTAEEALELIALFRAMVMGETVDVDRLDDAQSLSGVANLPPRVNCATIAWQACERGIHQQQAAGGEEVARAALAEGIVDEAEA